MNRVCRILLVWILMLALPLQGYAAAIMPACDSASSHSMSASAMEHHHGAAHEGHTMHAAHSTQHDGHHQGMEHHHACGACAACCVGAVPATASVDWRLPPVAASPYPHPDALVSGVIPARLERPPRLV